MEKAKKNEISVMTIEVARKLPLDGKKNDKGEFTSLSMKRGLVMDDGKKYVERRVFRNADMDDVVVYDLELPLTLDKAKELYAESDILDSLWTALRIKTDGERAGKGSKPADPMSLVGKLVSALVAKGVPEVEAKKLVAMTEANMKKAGFGK